MKHTTLIKFGGSLINDKAACKKFFDSVKTLSKKGQVILVHGGGPEISVWLQKADIKPIFIDGLRYTDEAVLQTVEMVLSGKVNKHIVAELVKRGIPAAGISGKDGALITARRIKKLGFVGEPEKTSPGIVLVLLKSGFLPVVSPLCIDRKGQTLNVNADSVAMAIATALKVTRLVLLTDVQGVLGRDKKTICHIKTAQIPGLIKTGVITGGMIPKIKACANAVKNGVKEVWIACGTSGVLKLKGTVIN